MAFFRRVADHFGKPVVFPGKAIYLGQSRARIIADKIFAIENSEYKFVIAHEIGHQISDRAMGTWELTFDGQAGIAAPETCKCTGLDPFGNEVHCLQSSERQGAAQFEGYAHAFAGAVWNRPQDTECVFTYYKAFRQPSGAIEPPTRAKSCNRPARWAETHCPVSNRATEYDWMGFYTGVARSTSAPLTHADLRNVYGTLCGGGGPSTTCEQGDVPGWLALRNAAGATFGTLSARFQTFDNGGSAYGVTR